MNGQLTDLELRASPVPVSGPLTDAELRASAVGITGVISGLVSASQDGGWSVVVSNTPSGPVNARLVPPPGENIFVASAIAETKGAAKVILSVFCGVSSPFDVKVLKAVISQEDIAAVTGLIRGYRLFRFTTLHSAGTVVTIRGLDTSESAVNSNITARRNGPTIGGVEAEALGFASLYEEETGGGTKQTLFDFRETDNFPLTLNPGEGIALQQDGIAGVGVLSAAIYFRQF